MSFLLIPSAISITSASAYLLYNYLTSESEPPSEPPSRFTKEIELLSNKLKSQHEAKLETKQKLLNEIKSFDQKQLYKVITVVKDVSKVNYLYDLISRVKTNNIVKHTVSVFDYRIAKGNNLNLVKHRNKPIIQQPKNKKQRKNGN